MTVEILQGDCLDILPTLAAGSVDCCVTSPPYWGLRDYGCDGQFGLESTPDEFVAKMVAVFSEVKRVLRDDGTLWLNLGDSYYGGGRGGNPEESEFRKQATNAGSLVARTKIPQGMKAKDLCGIPWRVAFALQADGWYLRSDIIWHKPNPMPESVSDRPTKAHEYIFLLSKSERYHFNQEAVRLPPSGVSGGLTFGGRHKGPVLNGQGNRIHGREATPEDRDRYATEGANIRTVWTVTTKPYKAAHFATFPPDLIKPCILAGCPEGGTVLDPFAGSGTTGQVARDNGCNATLIELNPEYVKLIKRRLQQRSLLA